MDEAPIQLEAPSKVVTTNTSIEVRARVACFDCRGKSDARSIREILVQVAPQQLILIHGLPQVSCLHCSAMTHHSLAHMRCL